MHPILSYLIYLITPHIQGDESHKNLKETATNWWAVFFRSSSKIHFLPFQIYSGGVFVEGGTLGVGVVVGAEVASAAQLVRRDGDVGGLAEAWHEDGGGEGLRVRGIGALMTHSKVVFPEVTWKTIGCRDSGTTFPVELGHRDSGISYKS